MKKYLLFCGSFYYPNGGIGDYEGDFDSVDDAKSWMIEDNRKFDWFNIIEHKSMQLAEWFPK